MQCLTSVIASEGLTILVLCVHDIVGGSKVSDAPTPPPGKLKIQPNIFNPAYSTQQLNEMAIEIQKGIA